MYRGNNNRVFPIIVAIIVIALIVTAIVSAIRAIFSPSSSTEQVVDTTQSVLFDTSGASSVRMTVRGPIVADENFHSYRVVVSSQDRSLTTYNGYLDTPIDTLNYSNNSRGYDEFVHALDKANIFRGEAFTGEKDDTRGICATGRLYEFELLQGSSVSKRLWTSTCKGSPGSLKASKEQLHSLFVEQIPDYKKPLQTIHAISG